MATDTGIIAIFGILDAAGLKRPTAWDALDAIGIVKTWKLQLSGLSDEEAVGAARAFVAQGSAFYPTAGQLVRASPVVPRLLLVAPEEPWCPEAARYRDRMISKHGHESKWGVRRRVNVAIRLIELQDAHDSPAR